MIAALELFIAAVAASTLGSMVGLGGGFILVPLLRLAFGFAPAEAAGTSLAMVIATGLSSTFSNLRAHRIDLRVGALVIAGGIPGSIIGSLIVHRIASPIFDWLFAALVVIIAIDFAFRRSRVRESAETTRVMHPVLTLLCGLFAGLLAGLFGIGGGIVIVPALAYLSDIPIHSVTATSQFVIAMTSPVGFVTHALEGDTRWLEAIPLFLGGVVGGAIGPRLSARLHSRQMFIVISLVLVLAAGAMLLRDVRSM